MQDRGPEGHEVETSEKLMFVMNGHQNNQTEDSWFSILLISQFSYGNSSLPPARARSHKKVKPGLPLGEDMGSKENIPMNLITS